MQRYTHLPEPSSQPSNPSPTAYVLGMVLVLFIGVGSAIAFMHWMQCSQESVALCVGPMLLRLKHARWRWADRATAAVRVLWLRQIMRWEEDALDNMTAVHEALPLDMEAQRRRIGALRADLLTTEAAARGEA
jgi:hypothetical protein